MAPDFNSIDYRLHRNDLYGSNDKSEGRPMHLVPCRWQRNGWKYVEADPQEHHFFNNPNRVNSIGFSPKKLQEQHRNYQKAMAAEGKFEEYDRFAGTTYQSFFKK